MNTPDISFGAVYREKPRLKPSTAFENPSNPEEKLYATGVDKAQLDAFKQIPGRWSARSEKWHVQAEKMLRVIQERLAKKAE